MRFDRCIPACSMVLSLPWIALFILWPAAAYTQTGWQQVHPYADGTAVTTEDLWSVHFVDSLRGFVAGDRHVLRSADGGVSWEIFDIGITEEYPDLRCVTFSDPLHGWLVGGHGIIFKTTDGGESWRDISYPDSFSFEKLIFSDSLNGWLAGMHDQPSSFPTEACIFRTTDGGESWGEQHYLSSPPGFFSYGIIDMQFVDDSIGYAVGWDGLIVKTSDSGQTWKQLVIPWQPSFFALHFYDELHGEVHEEHGSRYSTTDGGMSWERLFPAEFIMEYAFINDSVGYRTGANIKKSTDGGRTWRMQQYPLRNHPKLAIQFSDATHGWTVGVQGVILRTTDGGVMPVEDVPRPSDLSVTFSPNPLPRGSEGRIDISLRQTGEVIVELYDILGRKVRTLHRGELPAGSHALRISAQQYRSGVYVLLLRSNAGSASTQLLIR